MKALTLRQPWASLVSLGVKTIETRSWEPPASAIGRPLAIHAGARKPRRIWVPLNEDPPAVVDLIAMGRYYDIEENINEPGEFSYHWAGPLGAVVATCTLVDVVPTSDLRWTGLWAGWAWQGLGGSCVRHVPCLSDRGPVVVNQDERPYGDFTTDRYAWLLDDIKHVDPIPAKGKQGLWEYAA